MSTSTSFSTETKVETDAKTSTHSSGERGPVQVWLVDDQANLRKLIAETLEREGGICCTRQFHSPKALLSALASRIGPDVILLDVQMGDANGIDAIPAIKSLARTTRVLMLTTCYDQDWHQQAIESGASGYLLKTDPLERLTGSIRSRGDAADNALMRAEPVKINFRRRTPGCSETVQPPPRKERGLMRWFKRFAKN